MSAFTERHWTISRRYQNTSSVRSRLDCVPFRTTLTRRVLCRWPMRHPFTG